MHYRYPFIYGQPDTRQFPLATALGGELATAGCATRRGSSTILTGCADADRADPHPGAAKRGIVAAPDEILITLGSQNALYLLTRLLLSSTTRIGVENPCFREAINTFLLADAEVVPHPVDEEGSCLMSVPAITTMSLGHQVPPGDHEQCAASPAAGACRPP